MRIGILGDIHGNQEALTSTIEAMQDLAVDHWVQVGDIVGYGAEPRECIAIVRELGCTVCIGNHDAAVVGQLPTDYFNPYARQAVEWTRSKLTAEELRYLGDLPLVVENKHYTLVHGSLHMPDQFGYVISVVEATESLRNQKTAMGFVGHSHVPAIYMEREGPAGELEVVYAPEVTVSTDGCRKVLMNVGSVGQPRDEDPRAAYAIYDTETNQASIRRVEYDIPTTQQKIRDAGLPAVLADRLALGV